jgi:hypothetical protein
LSSAPSPTRVPCPRHALPPRAQGWDNGTADGTPMMAHSGNYAGFETNMVGYLGGGPGGAAAAGSAGRFVAVAASNNIDSGDGPSGGECPTASSGIIDDLVATLATRYWDA